jgi:hypothetical protein
MNGTSEVARLGEQIAAEIARDHVHAHCAAERAIEGYR